MQNNLVKVLLRDIPEIQSFAFERITHSLSKSLRGRKRGKTSPEGNMERRFQLNQ
jgi:hypothetical protein